MTPKEKAIELYNKFRNENTVMSANFRAKKQATICVDEIIDTIEFMAESHEIDKLPFWIEVKKEIEGL